MIVSLHKTALSTDRDERFPPGRPRATVSGMNADSQARATAANQQWLLTVAQARAAGLTRSEVSARLRTGSWLSVLPGVYLLDPDLYDAPESKLLWQAALLAHGADACLVGRTAARAHGMAGLPPTDPAIEVALTSGVPRAARRLVVLGDRTSVVVRQIPIAAADVVELEGLRVREPASTVVDAALEIERANVLCLFDWALHTGAHTVETLAAGVATARGRPGVRVAQEMSAIADGRAASPLESRVRLACTDGDVPPDELQYAVIDRQGVVLGYGDLAWTRNRRRVLIAEADGGDVHSRLLALYRDRRRANDFLIHACDIVRFTWVDALRPAYVRSVVASALAA